MAKRDAEGYRRLVERSPDGICVFADGAVVFVNDAGVKLMSADSSELSARFPCYDADGVTVPLAQWPALVTMREGVPYFNQVFGFDRLGAERRWVISSCRLLNPALPASPTCWSRSSTSPPSVRPPTGRSSSPPTMS